MSVSRNHLPSHAQIKKHWAPWLVSVGKFDSVAEVFDGKVCFACGFEYAYLDRAHIKAKCDGGSDRVDNLHLLCRRCHKASEFRSGGDYFDWLCRRHVYDVWLTEWFWSGGSFQELARMMA